MSDRVFVEDLESANGTFVRSSSSQIPNDDTDRRDPRDRRLSPGERMEVDAGALIYFGSALAMVQARSAAERPRRLHSHEYFEERLEEECGRAERERAVFAILRIVHPGANAAVERLLFELTEPSVVIARTTDEYELLLPSADQTRAHELAETIETRLRQRGVAANVHCATYPANGRSPEALLEWTRRVADDDDGGPCIVIGDERMQELFRLLERVAASDATVLLLGETGVGKEVLADRIHQLSPRRAQPMLKLNCAALPETLLESELFGHEKGAFTGADKARAGLIESADGGTLFLDELGEMPLGTQVKFLRVLEQRSVMRVGGREPRAVDLRFIAATNRDLEREVLIGGFRSDLYFRLNVFPLLIPPLRERKAEIEPLARALLEKLCATSGRRVPTLSNDAVQLLLGYDWPGNIRELRNMLERALVLCDASVISGAHLPAERMQRRFLVDDSTPASVRPDALEASDLPSSVAKLEYERILAALDACGGNQTRAAQQLGISRKTLLRRLDAYRLPRPRKPPA